jgi:hypothetical protein
MLADCQPVASPDSTCFRHLLNRLVNVKVNAMQVRAILMMILLLTQSLGAFAAAWDSPPGVGAITHCQTAGMQESEAENTDSLPATGETHNNCDESCGLCAACVGLLASALAIDVLPPRIANPKTLSNGLRAGIASPLYRPPILS